MNRVAQLVCIVGMLSGSATANAQNSDWGGPKSINLVNRSDETVVGLTISSTDDQTSQATVTWTQSIVPGDMATFRLIDMSCIVNIKVFLASGGSLAAPNYDLCENRRIIIGPGGLGPK